MALHSVIALKYEPIFNKNPHVNEDIAFLAHTTQGSTRLVRWGENQRESHIKKRGGN